MTTMFPDDPWSGIRAAGREIAEGFLAATDRIDHLLAEAARFGERGWPLNPDWDSAELASLVDAFGEAEFNDVFVAFYECENGARISHAFADIATRDTMERWRPIIQQSEQALDRGQHALIVPALLTVLEGRVFANSTNTTSVRQEVKRTMEAQGNGFSRMVWQTILDFVNALFAHSDFEAVEPHFNRHWILHGRASAGWERADVIRLLHGIHTIDQALTDPA
ncbi:MAG: hypothetical protein ACI9OJ_000862 [Myxococcota bacterium]|jgi:hypothetical protein